MKNTKQRAATAKKEQHKKDLQNRKVWLFGLHAVRQALLNHNRIKYEILITPNAHKKLLKPLAKTNLKPQIVHPRNFSPPLEKNSVHQGVALRADLLHWGSLSEICSTKLKPKLVLLLDRVNDPQNIGAIMRSAQVFGATAVIAPQRHSCAETGALVKSASGAFDTLPYLRVPNLAQAIKSLKEMGYNFIGLDENSETEIEMGLMSLPRSSIAIILGSEGSGLRDLTRRNCDQIVKISSKTSFGSLNVSNAAAISLFLSDRQIKAWNI